MGGRDGREEEDHLNSLYLAQISTIVDFHETRFDVREWH